MYRIAVIQNESEMMRYGWADIRPALTKFGYRVDGFTGENIDAFFNQLSPRAYDAVFLASNACNNPKILHAFRDQTERLGSFLSAGRGLFVGNQAKLYGQDAFGILPEQFEFGSIVRSRTRESTTDATLVIDDVHGQHPVVTYPNPVVLDQLVRRCRDNNLVRGVYWAHLVAKHEGIYEPIVMDAHYEPRRQLVLVSRGDLHARIVISAIVVDWQGHDSLWENIVRYVVEGRPSIALIAKRGMSSANFRYVAATLRIKKLGSVRYELNSLAEFKTIRLGAHDSIVLDPAWDRDEVLALNRERRFLQLPGISRVFFFHTAASSDTAINILSRAKELDFITANAVNFLRAAKDPQSAYWGGSFWTTVDVLATLREFGVDITSYRDLLEAELNKHDIDGSYDEVLGTTCGLLELYGWLYGRDHDKYQRTLGWIQQRLSSKTISEQATAYDVLTRLNERVDSAGPNNFKDEVLRVHTALTNEPLLQRYVRTLLTCGFIREASDLALRFEPLQDEIDGSWINVANTAMITRTLIELQLRSSNPDARIYDMIFAAVEFLKATYDEKTFSWNEDPLATALALRTLKLFEDGVNFPVDELLFSLARISREADSLSAVKTSATLIQQLQTELATTRAAFGEREKALTAQLAEAEPVGKQTRRLAIVSASAFAGLLSFVLLIAAYLVHAGKWPDLWEAFSDFVINLAGIASYTVAIVPLLFLLVVLYRLGALPQWVRDLARIKRGEFRT